MTIVTKSKIDKKEKSAKSAENPPVFNEASVS